MALAHPQLDAILGIQVSVAWAGERERCAWWNTDLVDRDGAGDLFTRLAPRTARWASLILVRAAAREVERVAREKIARADTLRTLFHLGFATDEQLGERLTYHRAHGADPRAVFGEQAFLDREWSRADFEAWLGTLAAPKVEITPAGRAVKSKAKAPETVVPLLAAALAPLATTYPLPHLEVDP